ncbi:MAG: hypothetical protein RLZZ385_1975 [Pseudomonadota bacterium]|jgi:hypothetical protein
MTPRTDPKTQTAGGRLELEQLPLPAVEDGKPRSLWQRWYRNASLFVAGMYTGVKCYGVPQDHPGADRSRDHGPL